MEGYGVWVLVVVIWVFAGFWVGSVRAVHGDRNRVAGGGLRWRGSPHALACPAQLRPHWAGQKVCWDTPQPLHLPLAVIE